MEMSSSLSKFRKFKELFFRAVQIDTEMGLCESDSRFIDLQLKTKAAWQDAAVAEKEFLECLK